MASTEYDHCKNCLHFINGNFCKHRQQETNKKGWCGDQIRRSPLDVNDIAVEYEYRRDHIILEMSGKNPRPIEDVLKGAGWDGVERLKQGKFPEDNNEGEGDVKSNLQSNR